MAMTEALKQNRADQVVAAREQFELYKDYIVKEFVDKFGGSYQNAESMKNIWRTAFVYTPKCEKFLIEKTSHFILLMSGQNRKTQGPVFFKNLIGLISEYLAVYISKKGISRNDCTKALIEKLFDRNDYVQSKIKVYTRQNEKAWGLKQKEKRKKTKGKFFKSTTEVPVFQTADEKRKKVIAFKIIIDSTAMKLK